MTDRYFGCSIVFTELVQRILNSDKSDGTILTSDNVPSIFTCGSPLCFIIYGSYQWPIKNDPFFWPTR